MNNTIRLGAAPCRIVSLVPSQTELLYHLELNDEVVGITKFCIHPDEWYTRKKRVGGTKNVDIEKVIALKPDLIIGNKEENDQANIQSLQGVAPVWMSDISNLEEAIEMISQIGKLTNRERQAARIMGDISTSFERLIQLKEPLKVLYFIWRNPDMIAGKDTFIDAMLFKCGFINLASKERYPEPVGHEQPDHVFLSSEPYPFKEKHVKEFSLKYPTAKIHLVDGEYFSWYGSRLIDAPAYFNKLLLKIQ